MEQMTILEKEEIIRAQTFEQISSCYRIMQ